MYLGEYKCLACRKPRLMSGCVMTVIPSAIKSSWVLLLRGNAHKNTLYVSLGLPHHQVPQDLVKCLELCHQLGTTGQLDVPASWSLRVIQSP